MDNSDKSKTSVRLKDVATNAGVSETTASMVFSGQGRISEDTVKTVMDVATQMGYVHQKRKRKSQESKKNVALLLLMDSKWTMLWHFLSEMINQLEFNLKQLDLNLVLVPMNLNESEESIYKKIQTIGCRAVYSVHYGNENLFQKLEKDNIPVIVILNNNFLDKYYSICVDDFVGAYEGTKHLIDLGHKNIFYIDDLRENLPSLTTDRYYGYRKALEEGGLSFHDDQRYTCSVYSTTNEREHIQEIFQRENPPTALFCLDDAIAFRVWTALTKEGIRIPEDVSIMAVGDVLDYSKPYFPAISTMHINMSDLGRLAVNMLQNRLTSEQDPIHVMKVKPQLIERNSCRPFKD